MSLSSKMTRSFTTIRQRLVRTMSRSHGCCVILSAMAAAPLAAQQPWSDLGHATPGAFGIPQLTATPLVAGRGISVRIDAAHPLSTAVVILGARTLNYPFLGGEIVPMIDVTVHLPIDGFGRGHGAFPIRLPPSVGPGSRLYLQALVFAPTELAYSSAKVGVVREPIGADFDADGFEDLAAGCPFEDIGGAVDAGAVNIVYGGFGGLGLPRNQFLNQGDSGGRAVATDDDRFGQALAHGDFNGDGYTDLAVGCPGQNLFGQLAPNAGEVNVLFGGPTGLSWQGAQIIRTGSEADDWLGSTLAVGNFNGDAYADLAIGVPNEDFGSPLSSSYIQDAGAVVILHGGPSGLTQVQVWDQSTLGETREEGDGFGSALATGEFDGDPRGDDLAIGVAGEDLRVINHDYGSTRWLTQQDAGLVHVVFSNGLGLAEIRNRRLHQWRDYRFPTTDPHVLNSMVPSPNDQFGAALAAGDFNADGRDDLAIGVPMEGSDVSSGLSEAGAVVIIDWSARTEGRVLTQATIGGSPASGERFGWSLTVSDFDGNGHDDLAVGVPYHNVNGIRTPGQVDLIYGRAGGLDPLTGQTWIQDMLIVTQSARYDHFGHALGHGDYDGNGVSDLVVGTPYKDANGSYNTGAAFAIYGWQQSGLSRTSAQMLHEGLGLGDGASSPDMFAYSLAN